MHPSNFFTNYIINSDVAFSTGQMESSYHLNSTHKTHWLGFYYLLQDILRCYTKTHGVNEKRMIDGTPCHAILSVEPKLEANFELHDKAEPESKKLGLLR